MEEKGYDFIRGLQMCSNLKHRIQEEENIKIYFKK